MNSYAFGGVTPHIPRPLARHPHSMAHGLASLGRGTDTTLVHMSPKEVLGLQKLAMAHGGSLTINPDTGFPEAGFLSKLLPMLGGVLLGVATGGLSLPSQLAVAGGVGAADKAVTGDSWATAFTKAAGVFGGLGVGGALSNIGATTTALGTPTTTLTIPATSGAIAPAATADTYAPVATVADTTAAAPTANLASAQAADLSGGVSGGIGAPVATPTSTLGVASTPEQIQYFADLNAPPAPTPAGVIGPQGTPPTTNIAAHYTETIPNGLQAYGGDINKIAFGPVPAGAPGSVTLENVGKGVEHLYGQPGLGGGIKELYANLGQGAGLGTSGLANATVAASALAPALYNPSQPETPNSVDMSYYVPAPGYNSLYNPGRINPNIARLGYLPAGQEAFIGQGFNPGVYSKTAPVGIKAGGLMGIKHMATGGQPTPINTPTGIADLNKYYGDAAAQYTSQPVIEVNPVTEPPPSSAAMDTQLAKLQQMVTPVTETGGTATYEPATSPVPGPTGSTTPTKTRGDFPTGMMGTALYNSYIKQNPSTTTPTSGYNPNTGSTTGSAMSYVDPTTGKMVNLPQYSYNPKTGFKLESGSANSYTDPKTGKSLVLPQYSYDPKTGGYTVTNADEVAAAQAANTGFHQSNNLMTEFGHAPVRFFNDLFGFAHGGDIHGGLGAYADTYAAGGKLLRGDGDGMSDSIPAVITGAEPQRAALADGEFVIPADVVSHLGNGSTEAGSKTLYKMMDKVRRARTGNPKQGKQINPNKYLPV